MTEGNGEARGYSWPPFEPGHERSMVHGAQSERRVAPLAEAIATALLEDEATPDHLRRPEFAASVAAWARAEAVASLVWQWLADQDIEVALTDVTRTAETEEGGKGKVTRRSVSRRVAPVLEQWRRFEAHAANLRRALGLDPVGAARVARDLSTSRYYAAASPLDKALEKAEKDRQRAVTGGDAGTGGTDG